MEAGYSVGSSKLKRAVDGMLLSSKLRYVSGPTYETFNNLSNTYATNTVTAQQFVRDLVTSQAYSGSGVLNSSSEFSNFDTAFPSIWTDPDPTDNQYIQVKYTFTPLAPSIILSPQQISFEYELN